MDKKTRFKPASFLEVDDLYGGRKVVMVGADGIAPLSTEMTAAIEKLREGGQTSMVVRRAGKDLGAIGLLDTPREAARDALEKLRAIGIKRMIMISGDHQRAAQAIDESFQCALPYPFPEPDARSIEAGLKEANRKLLEEIGIEEEAHAK